MKQIPQPQLTDTNADYRLEDQVGYWLRRAYQRHMAIFAAACSNSPPSPTIAALP